MKSTEIRALLISTNILAIASPARPDIFDAGKAFFTENYSPRAIALGSCGASLVITESGVLNPAGLGQFHLDHLVAYNLSGNLL
jgi:hypothetical protein